MCGVFWIKSGQKDGPMEEVLERWLVYTKVHANAENTLAHDD